MSDILHCSHLELAARLRAEGRTVDTLIVDAPYSERTHSGHDDGVAGADRMRDYASRPTSRGQPKDLRYALRKAERTGQHRRSLAYASWTAEHVAAFVEAWSPLVTGWIVSLTDDNLFQHWRAYLEASNRQTFQDVPALIRGMSVRLTGDGPSSWAIHCAVARPRTREMARWGTLDGGYVGPTERQPVVGGKPLWLMRALVRDYSRPGGLVCDPCCGGGTTLLAAQLEGRRYLGCDLDAAHVEITRRRLDGRDPIAGAQTDLWDALAREPVRHPPPEAMHGAEVTPEPAGFTEPDHYSACRDSYYDRDKNA